MAKPESKKSSLVFGASRSAAAEEQINNGSLDLSPTGGSHDQAPAAPAAKPKSGKQGSRENGARRTTECEVFDDGTNTFFWRAHTLTVLFILTCALVYVTLLEETPQDTAYNTKRDRGQHFAYWRFWLCVTVVYELFLIFILFQTVHDGRQFMKYIDPKLGVPLPERDYGGNCLIYDPGNTTDPYHNIWDKMDGFVPAHFLGWYIKTLMIRDWWMCMIISVMFEFLEGKIKRIAFQFTPYSWVKFEWKPASNLRRKFHKKLGQQAWLVAAITVTEFLIVVKYDPNTIMLPIPFFVTQCWILGIVLILTWTLWRFFIRDITLRYKETRRRKQEGAGDYDRSHGNGNTAATGRSKLNGSSDSVKHRKS
ncbi:hypothetical protein JZ751_004183 [Albula glossodonta]|uniref:Phosphatidylserine synthase n=1 Tax=Albula glossodonta TaxID=121402 RepID=A0A8T2N6Y8_9TELE|nr:hypothetical protein JZ751_004183 [Albula glossodonta]